MKPPDSVRAASAVSRAAAGSAEGDRDAMRCLAWLATMSVASIVGPAAALALPILMTPNPLGDWIGPSSVTANVSLQSGDTQPVPTVVLRAVVDGNAGIVSTANFDFLFDVAIVAASVTGQSGGITIGPFLFTTPDPRFRRLSFVCGQASNSCTVDITFELVSPPATLDVTDANDFFSSSPGAPNQVLSATFSSAAPSVPALGTEFLAAAVAALLLTGGWALSKANPLRAE